MRNEACSDNKGVCMTSMSLGCLPQIAYHKTCAAISQKLKVYVALFKYMMRM